MNAAPDGWGGLEPTERLIHVTPSGAKIEINLVQRDDGWRYGLSYLCANGGQAFSANIRNKSFPTRSEVLFAVKHYLLTIASKPIDRLSHTDSPKEAQQRQEVRDWCLQQEISA